MTELIPAHLDHRRSWAEFVYCYPVISRRSKGVSLGVNLNPDKVCNFDCVYCEVDRTTPGRRRDIDLDQLERELSVLLDVTLDGSLFTFPPFDSARPDQRRLNDIAFSGDGEPTTAKEFAEAVERVAHLKWMRGLQEVKLVLITDSSRLQAREVVQGLDTLMANNGEIWAKLDAGTEAYYQEINRTSIPFGRIIENIEITARLRPITIQSLFLSWKGHGPSSAEIAAYCDVLRGIQGIGGRFQAIQLYTVARPTPEPEARPLRAKELDALADQVRAALPTVPVEVFYGPKDELGPEEHSC
ncbi:MAG: radical SAM protein [Holophagaceae bacterium]|nr:radical SAM protein [Holophagaceae bacterium]